MFDRRRRRLGWLSLAVFLCAAAWGLQAVYFSAPHTGLDAPLSASVVAAAMPRNVRFLRCLGLPRERGALAKSWEFERFDSHIQVNGDGSFTVRETQVVNFTGSFSFLTRDISTRLADFGEGRTYGKVRVKDVEVFNLDGTPYDSDLWEADPHSAGTLVRIEFQACNEQRGWVIGYRMQGAMIYAADYDRLYWNAVTNDRAVPIRHARITVSLPPGTPMDAVEFTDYYQESPGARHASGREGETIWWEAENIPPYTDFTIDVSIPKDIILKPWPYRTSTLWIMLLLAGAIFLGSALLMVALWFWKGRDMSGGQQPGVAYGPPHEQRPAVMAMLMYQRPKIEDIAATVVDLAVRGKLRIIEDPEEKVPGMKGFVFERREASTRDLLPYERMVMKGLFERGERVGEDDLRVWPRLPAIMNGIRKEVRKRRLFHGDPEKTVRWYHRCALALIILPPAAFIFLRFRLDLGYTWLLLAGTVAAGATVWMIGSAMPQRTALGSSLYRQMIGFREYLRTAEAGEPESMTLQNFQENLPYAMVLGMADRWSELFAGVLTTPPDWYSGPEPGFSTARLNSRLSGITYTLLAGGQGTSSGSHGSSGFSRGSGGGFGRGSSGGGFGGGGSSAG